MHVLILMHLSLKHSLMQVCYPLLVPSNSHRHHGDTDELVRTKECKDAHIIR